ncbi:MAG: DDE-type integrase/transposase/recombinase [Polyangiaceae bacterium]|nr:DDE-type integrase/transposase/recombinase [Polyangiaceae bacterium]
MSLKIEFVQQATEPGANLAALCRKFGVSRPTGYKWLRRYKQCGFAQSSSLSRTSFKGWWNAHDGERCNPLTVRDAFSKFVLAVKLTRSATAEVRAVFEQLFRKFGVPKAIQSDNGTPFVSVRAPGGAR